MGRGLRAGERQLRSWVEQVREGRLPRRDFIARLGSLGVAAPLAGLMLLDAGVAQAQPAFNYAPTKRGGGGTLKLLEWQGPTLLNPHFATGLKDNTGSRIFYEPLAEWDAEANLQPVLAAEIPSRDNGGLAADGKSVTWKLKKGVTWHDGAPFTADDVLFNWQYAIDPAAASVTLGSYRALKLEKIDGHTVRVIFDRPSPFWPGQYSQVMLIPRHLFAAYMGGKSRDAPNNLKPVGTGPYRFVEFRPADLLRGELNANYHRPNRPHFDRFEMKAGGDATSAARTVLQTGEYDYAGSLVIEDDVLKRMEADGKGRVVLTSGSSTSAVYLNFTDPGVAVDGERSHASTRHPLFSDTAVRRAVGLLIDRANLQAFVYGRQGVATGHFINSPMRYRSPAPMPEFNVEKARQLLDSAGWKAGADGVREKNGRKLSVLFQASSGAVTNKILATIKAPAEKAGLRIELKTVPPSVFFSSDAGNPDTYGKFQADMQTYSWTNGSPDPDGLAQCFVSWEVSSKANKWLGQNLVRWQDTEYDALYRAAESELDPVKRAGLFIRMNDRVCGDGYVIPFIARQTTRVLANRLRAPLSAWQNDMASLADWYRAA
jgi:peptide/nickel transport system substrate-binding protein